MCYDASPLAHTTIQVREFDPAGLQLNDQRQGLHSRGFISFFRYFIPLAQRKQWSDNLMITCEPFDCIGSVQSQDVYKIVFDSKHSTIYVNICYRLRLWSMTMDMMWSLSAL